MKIMKKALAIIGALALIFTSIPVSAHSGRTDASGGHWDRKNGTYHYHNSGSTSTSNSSSASSSSSTTSVQKAEIKKHQQKLNDLGYNCGTPDGTVGKNTKNAITKFQEAEKLTVTGQLDDKTVSVLNAKSVSIDVSADETLTKADIEKHQKQLNELGYECGTPDGVIGKKTKAAIEKFQKDKNLEVTSKFDAETLIELYK